MMKHLAITFAALCVFAGAGAAQDKDLSHEQKQAVDRQTRNLNEAKKKLDSTLDTYAKEMKELGTMLAPPAFFQKHLTSCDEVETKCVAMETDLSKSGAPDTNAKVKAIKDWIKEARPKLEGLKQEIAPKLAESKKLSDPKNYPNLEPDFDKIEEMGQSYAINNFLNFPDKVAELAVEFPRVTKWCSEKFAEYRPLVVLTGGKESPLYRRYEKTAKAIKGFQEQAGKFVGESEKLVPGLLSEAEEMAKKAAADKKPAFFTGGVKQKLDQAMARLKVCRGLLQKDDKRLIAMEEAHASAQKRIDVQAESLKSEILAATRAPDEKYKGADRQDIEKAIRAEWKKEWPKDEILGVKFHMESFDRSVKWSWSDGGNSWSKSDLSVLCVTVIVKTSAKIATMYPAYVNVDNLSEKTKYGVATKGGIYVNTEVLIENLK